MLAAIVIGVGVAVGVSLYNSHKAKLAAMPTYSANSFVVMNDYAGIQAAAEEAEHEAAEADGDGEEAVPTIVAEDTAAEETAAE